MKRLWVSILLLVYFTVSSGFVVNLHYCMGDLAGVEWGTSKKGECGKCGMPVNKKAGCCQDDVKLVKIQQDQAAATFAVFAFGVQQALPVASTFLFQSPLNVAPQYTPPAHAPPLISKQETYLFNCVFRI